MALFINNINQWVASSFIGRYFALSGSSHPSPIPGTCFTKELRGGIATFVAMAYIISVNATIVTDSGGTCKCSVQNCSNDPAYQACLIDIKKDLITVTALISAFASAMVGIFANLPFGLAPGLGLNVYFAYTVVGFHGSGTVSYQTALAAIFIEGLLFILLTLLGARRLLTILIPNFLKAAICCGIGLFLCFIGFQSAAGIGLITGDHATLVTLGGCPPEHKKNGICDGHVLQSARTWLGIAGVFLIVILQKFRIKGAILIGIVVVSLISWFRHTVFTAFPLTPEGNAAYSYFAQVVDLPRIRHTFFALNFDLSTPQVWFALLTFLYVDLLDTTGAMFSMARYAGRTDEKGDFQYSTRAFCCDAVAITLGALLGTPPVTTYVESGVGIAEGGKTGLTACVIAFFFAISLFFAPVFASFPPWATGPALIVLGVMMMKECKEIDWERIEEAVPAFMTIILMPLTFSIAYGIIAGLFSYCTLTLIFWLCSFVCKRSSTLEEEVVLEKGLSK